ncbi:MAG: 50S ribosomal protein L3 N(5)-glutamine methyltransferase [Gammaproteobacteria bacterium]|nr:50S ribosomal protein L3 N(5)-glutamine methyltransferase [Gammaproteobacteria bacterium]NNL07262.1 50S ribosomal protein L3 N(5)-glutamine methyltransferase [Gammaproteobacteria bacterium]
MNIRAIAGELHTIRDLVRWAMSQFNKEGLCFAHGMPDALDEAVYICLATLHLPPDLANDYLDCRLTHEERRAVLENYRIRLSKRKPAAYITREAWFAGLSFYVDERVLIPRSPIAELIQQQFSPWIDENRVERVLDLCTGSGCIAIACAYAFEQAEIVASDISADALDVAIINRSDHGLEQRMTLIESDLFADIPQQQFDIIVSNPPYVSEREIKELDREFSFEPSNGLAAGKTGMDYVIPILQQAGACLSDHGILVVEVGYSMPALIELLPEVPFTWLEFAHGGEGVFLLSAEQLRECQPMFDAL